MRNSVNILAVSDHHLALDNVVTALARFYKSTTVTSYSDLESLLKDKLMLKMQDHVLVDISLLADVGLELASVLKNWNAAPPFLAMGTADQSNLELALRYGAKDFVTADTPSEELFQTVEALLARQSQNALS